MENAYVYGIREFCEGDGTKAGMKILQDIFKRGGKLVHKNSQPRTRSKKTTECKGENLKKIFAFFRGSGASLTTIVVNGHAKLSC